MKFKLENGGEIEISGITSVVESTVEYKGGKKQKVGDSWLWIRNQGKKGFYWVKYPYKDNYDVGAIVGGQSHDDMLGYIHGAAFSGAGRVWFEGACCNVEKDLQKYEKIQKRLNEISESYSALTGAINAFTEKYIFRAGRGDGE
jgi:hypothetical protein